MLHRQIWIFTSDDGFNFQKTQKANCQKPTFIFKFENLFLVVVVLHRARIGTVCEMQEKLAQNWDHVDHLAHMLYGIRNINIESVCRAYFMARG